MFVVTFYDLDEGIDYDPSRNIHPNFVSISYNEWAKENCLSYNNFKVMDVSDISWSHDSVFQYFFNEELDAIIFNLKFGGELKKN